MLQPWLSESFQDFAQACRQGRLPGSVIIAGRNDAGAFELALECARFYLCEHKEGGVPCGSCKSCRLLDNAAHPDFVMVRSSLKDEVDAGTDLTNDPKLLLQDNQAAASESPAGRRSVRIDSIRRLIDWLQISHALTEGKAAIINDAHTMSEEAANSILKSFEEPPVQTLIIVVAKSLEALLPTIRSRAYKILLKEPTLQQGLEYLSGFDFTGRRAQTALALSLNAPYGALRLLQSGTDEKAVEIIELLCRALKTGQDSELIDKLLALGPEGQVMILGELVRELLKYKAGTALELLPLLDQNSAGALCRLPAEHLFAAYDELRHFSTRAPFIPPRAPAALLRAWVQALAATR